MNCIAPALLLGGALLAFAIPLHHARAADEAALQTTPVRAFERYCVQTGSLPAVMKAKLKTDKAKAIRIARVAGLPKADKRYPASHAQAWQVNRDGVPLQIAYRRIEGEPGGRAGLLHECSVSQSVVRQDAIRQDLEQGYRAELSSDDTVSDIPDHFVSYNVDFGADESGAQDSGAGGGLRPVTLAYHAKPKTPLVLSVVTPVYP